MLEVFKGVPIKETLLVVYGGLFGWTLGKFPQKWVYVVLAVAVLLTIVVVL
jgi:low affinity Fe/Cu permease